MERVSRLLVSMLLVMVTACSNADNSQTITAEELASRINDGSAPVILDVRPIEEFNSGHVPGAINIPLGSKEQLPTLNLEKGQELVVYSKSGKRASIFANYMREEGYFEMRLLDGSMMAWKENSLPVE